MISVKTALALAAAISAASVAAQNVDGPPPVPHTTYAELRAMSVPVTAADITDHPYKVIGKIKTNIRKATILSGPISDDKARRELWERGRKMGADAVINAVLAENNTYSTRMGLRLVTGDAVRFVDGPSAAVEAGVPANK